MPLPPVSEKKFTEGFGPGGATTGKLRIIVTGAGGFIASHLSKRLKAEGHFVRGVDWKENEYMEPSEFCDEFKNLDLRWPDKCKEALEDGPWDWCFNLAADMGGMGFIQSNHSRILFNSTMISFNVAEAARVAGVKRFWCAPPDPAARLGAQLGARKFLRNSAHFGALLRRAALPPPSQVRVVGVHLPRVQATEGGPRGRVGAEGGRRVAGAAAGRVRPREADDRGAAHALRGGLRDGVPDRPLP